MAQHIQVEVPLWVKVAEAAALMAHSMRTNQVKPEQLPACGQEFLKIARIEEGKAWLYEVVKRADTMPLEELEAWIDAFPSGWERSRLMTIQEKRQKPPEQS